MSGTENPTGQTTAPVITQSDLDKARAEGHAAGIAAESARVSGILALPSAKGNPELAQTCISGGLTAEQAKGVLDAAPQAATPAASAALAAGGTDDGAPGPRPHYEAAYYGCFVRDLDGHKIEAMAWLGNPAP